MKAGIQPRRRFGQIARGRQGDIARHCAKPDHEFISRWRSSIQPNRLSRSIMAGQLPRRLDPRTRRNLLLRTQHSGDLVACNRSGAQDRPATGWAHRNNRRFKAACALTAIENQIDPLAQRGGNMRRAGRTDRAATIGRRRGQRQACRSDQRPHHGVRRAPQRNRRQSGRNCRRQGRIRTTRHNQRQRPGPERVGQRPRRGIEIGQRFSLRDIADMHDQRVEIWSPLCSINRGNRLIAVGARSQTIDGFGRHRDRAPGTNNLGRMDQRVTLREKAVGLCRRHRVSL